MKVVKTDSAGEYYMTIEEAINGQIRNDIYGSKSTHILAKLIDKLCENGHIKTAQLKEILGYGYEVRMD